ncbi:MAG: preprotein translocase subunit YajC [Clostridiales bacterium]|jgi:preprotein translocase subunit YajC|nr:preprotein translocase subunit YajC [Clostridiales bacterium]
MILLLSKLLVLGIIQNNTEGSAAAASQGAQAAEPGAAFGGFNSLVMILVWVAVIGIFYFFSIRPQSKRDKKLKEMQSAIKSGDNVLTTSGFYGKVADVGEDCFVIEFGTNRGVRVPVRKSDIIGIQTPKLSPSRPESGN